MAIARKKACGVVDGILNLLCRGDDPAEQWHVALWQGAYDLMGIRACAELGDYNGRPTVRLSGPDHVLALNFNVMVMAHYSLDRTRRDMEAVVEALMRKYRRV
jgi:hypothetical protein